jgi:hypothetical protein
VLIAGGSNYWRAIQASTPSASIVATRSFSASTQSFNVSGCSGSLREAGLTNNKTQAVANCHIGLSKDCLLFSGGRISKGYAAQGLVTFLELALRAIRSPLKFWNSSRMSQQKHGSS